MAHWAEVPLSGGYFCPHTLASLSPAPWRAWTFGYLPSFLGDLCLASSLYLEITLRPLLPKQLSSTLAFPSNAVKPHSLFLSILVELGLLYSLSWFLRPGLPIF